MSGEPFAVLKREPSGSISRFFNEIVTCRLADGSVRRLLLKRGVSESDLSYGHRGGLRYEAEVYRRVLEPLCTSAPRLHASNTNHTTSETTLLIDYITDAATLKDASFETVIHAARWIGVFHRLNESRVSTLRGLISEYDAAYYLGWMCRTLAFTRNLHLPWIPAARRCFKASVAELLSAPVTIIHGEYYPLNILVSGGLIVPVDWETAAIAIGEIDLATLSEGWDEDARRILAAEYRRARWGDHAPEGFERRLAIADMYLLFRWGEEWVTEEYIEARLTYLRRLSEQLDAFKMK